MAITLSKWHLGAQRKSFCQQGQIASAVFSLAVWAIATCYDQPFRSGGAAVEKKSHFSRRSNAVVKIRGCLVGKSRWHHCGFANLPVPACFKVGIHSWSQTEKKKPLFFLKGLFITLWIAPSILPVWKERHHKGYKLWHHPDGWDQSVALFEQGCLYFPGFLLLPDFGWRYQFAYFYHQYLQMGWIITGMRGHEVGVGFPCLHPRWARPDWHRYLRHQCSSTSLYRCQSALSFWFWLARYTALVLVGFWPGYFWIKCIDLCYRLWISPFWRTIQPTLKISGGRHPGFLHQVIYANGFWPLFVRGDYLPKLIIFSVVGSLGGKFL